MWSSGSSGTYQHINILVRLLLYVAETYQKYFIDKKMSLFDTDPVKMPEPELYVLYMGTDRKKVPSEITLSKDFFGGKDIAIDVKVKVLVGDSDGTDIISQYATFTRVYNEQVRIHGRTREAVEETIRICSDRNVLKEYLSEHRKEVVDIMMTLYDDDEILDNYVASMGRKIREERDRETIFAMSDDGDPDDKIARVMHMSVADVQKILSSRATAAV